MATKKAVKKKPKAEGKPTVKRLTKELEKLGAVALHPREETETKRGFDFYVPDAAAYQEGEIVKDKDGNVYVNLKLVELPLACAQAVIRALTEEGPPA